MDDYIWVPNHGAIGPPDSPSMWLDDGDVAGVPARAEKWGGGDVDRFELRRHGKLVVRRPTREQCIVEALERGWIVQWLPDFAGDKAGRSLADGVEIVEVANDNAISVESYSRRVATEQEAALASLDAVLDSRVDRGPYIGTHTGRFYMTDPRPEDFCIEDVAHGLSRICRYTGACDQHLSVAEHSVHISDWLLDTEGCKRLALIGLMHDAPEALSGFGDVSRPSKGLAPIIKEIEDGIYRKAVAPKFGLPADIPQIVHEVDSRIIADEMTQNMNECDPAHNNPLGIRLQFWSPAFAKAAFLMRFSALTVGARSEERRVA